MKINKLAEECENLIEIRQGIDAIDEEIIKLLGQRMNYVLSAAQFKPDEGSIPAPDRVTTMLQDRRCWAEEQGLSSDYIERLFGEIIQWFINQQVHYWRKKHGVSAEN